MLVFYSFKFLLIFLFLQKRKFLTASKRFKTDLYQFFFTEQFVVFANSVKIFASPVIPVKLGIHSSAQILNKFIAKFVFVGLTFFSLPFLQAQEVETIIKEVELQVDSKKLAQQKALNEISRQLVTEIVGEKKYRENKTKIEKSIIKHQNRYVLFISSSSGKFQDQGKVAFTVKIRVSKENLKNLLLENNLFYDSKGAFCILPIVSFSSYFGDKKENYSWWLDNKISVADLKSIAGAFFDLLSQEFIKAGFYVIDPVFQRVKEGAPSFIFPKKGNRAKEFRSMAEFYTCDIVLSGRIHTGQAVKTGASFLSNLFSSQKPALSNVYPESYFIQFSLKVFNIKTNQFLFNVQNKFSFMPSKKNQLKEEILFRSKNVLDSLIYQLSSVNDEGSLVLNRMVISVQGPLSYAEKEKLQKSLIKQVPGIEDLQVRLLNSSRVVYEAKSSQSIQDISKQLKSVSLPYFSIQVKGHRNQRLEIYAKKRTR